MRLKVIESVAEEQNFNSFNSFQNWYNIKQRKVKMPKGLIDEAYKHVEIFCKLYNINAADFRYVRASVWLDVKHSLRFHKDEDPDGLHIKVFNLYYDESNKQILQRTIMIEDHDSWINWNT